ncbi:MAG: GIY-YIG nuclease family protein [Hyphomonadaceae bacterium]
MAFYTYLLASQKNGTLYAGHTDDLRTRVFEHKQGRGAAFTRQHNVERLVGFGVYETREAAKIKEYQIKKWKRGWKIRLIEEANPDWRDLYPDLNNTLGF